MARNKNLIYIAEGFNEDCGTLVDALTDNCNKVDWQKFCRHWKEMEFDKLFFGRQSGPELVELTEECLQIARLFIVTETDNFEQQVVGVFIAYALIVIQPYKDLCALRLIPDDARPLKRIEAIARRDDRKDLLMALGKLYIYGHAHFHVSLRERSMDKCIRKYFNSALNVPKCISRRWHGNLDRNVISRLDGVAQKESEYARLKMIAKTTAEGKIPGIKVEVDTFKPQHPNIANALRQLTSGPKEEHKEEEVNMTTIKKRAMKQVVDPIKHLHGIAERKKLKEKVLNISPSKARARERRRHERLFPNVPPSPDNLPSSPDNHPPSPDKLPSDPDNIPPKPKHNQCISLPALDDPVEIIDRTDSPEHVFRGFTAQEIEQSKSGFKLPEPHQTHKPISPKATSKTACKRKSAPKRKRTLKNKNNKKLKLANDFNSDSNSSLDYSTDEFEPTFKEIKNLDDIRTYKGKELTLQTNAGDKQFVEFELNDLVIRTELDAVPDNDIEIEYIDNYSKNNAGYEDLCDISDDEKKTDDDDVEVVIEPCETNGDVTANGDDGIEVFEVIDSMEQNHKSVADDKEMKQEMKKILSKNKINAKVDRRRKLKQPSLRSKLKKMGILPVASFGND